MLRVGKLIKIHSLGTGTPVIHEEGGGSSNTGHAFVICGPQGERVEPLSVPKGESQGVHAVFRAGIGMHVVESEYDRDHEKIVVWRIHQIVFENKEETLVVTEVCRYEDGDDKIQEKFGNAADAAYGKAHCYHCREPHYVPEKVEKPCRG
jgi:hypothetical protein